MCQAPLFAILQKNVSLQYLICLMNMKIMMYVSNPRSSWNKST